MTRQTYLQRKSGRYHFRRRFSPEVRNLAPISIALGTADPIEARSLAHRLATRWDDVAMRMNEIFERGTLTLEEQRALFRQALKEELAHATRSMPGQARIDVAGPAHRKVIIAAYGIVGALRHDAMEIPADAIKNAVDESWTAAERQLLIKTLRIWITPMSVTRSQVDEALAAMGTPVNDATRAEARWEILRGRIEAQKRSELVSHPLFADRDVPAYHLMDDDLVERARRVTTPPDLAIVAPAQPASAAEPQNFGNGLFAKTTAVRFSEQIENLHDRMFEINEWQPDGGKTLLMLESFAWLTGDKPMSDYAPGDIEDYVARLARIPPSFKWGRLGKFGGMAAPYDPANFPAKLADVPHDQLRSTRTINSYLSKLQSASDVLKKTFWLPAIGFGNVMDFSDSRKKVEDDPRNPRRVPWTPDHLRAMYGLPLWQGSGGKLARVKASPRPMIYQDAAYWVPLIGTYTGLAREEACGLECIDFRFDCEVPYLLVQANMTRSKDGVNPAGLKRKSRYRVMPLHPELLDLGLQRYVDAIEADGHTMIFPELYLDEAKHTSVGENAPAYGGRRFYAIAWCYIMDATHAIMPLPETPGGKKADFHSQRTYNNSVLASPGVSETIIADHMGHARRGTGPKNYNRRGLALEQKTELSERLEVLVKVMPVVTDHIPRTSKLSLLPMIERSRVGSAEGRDAKKRFCK